MRKDQDAMLPKSGRQRALNVIYFIDAHKTRSFHLSLTKVHMLLGICFILVAWSLASMYFVARFIEQRDVLSDRLHTALATIFEYQSRYDGVYESAYPEIQVKSEVALASKMGKGSKSLGGGTALADEEDGQAGTVSPQDINEISNENLTIETSNPDWPITVEDLSFHRDQDELELSFAIRNKLSPSRSEGYIWAVATLQDRQGKVVYLGSPRGIQVDEDGTVSNPHKNANWYSIRYYKAKSFYFSLPSNWSGDITQFGIGMQDTTGKQSTFKVPLLKRLGENGKQPSSPKSPPPDQLATETQEGSASTSQAAGHVASKDQKQNTSSH